MSEDFFKEILGMALASEFSEFDNMLEHKFSLKHRLAMKRVFARFARNARKSERRNDVKIAQIGNHRTEIGLKKRLIVAVIIVFLALFLVGWIWIAESLYKLDSGSLKGYTVNETMLSQIKVENRIPTHKITDEQAEWLGSKYDLKLLSACSIGSEEYGNFILDLVNLNVFSHEEAQNLFGVMPFNANHKGYLYKSDTGDGLSGFVNPFGGEGNYIDENELSVELIKEYLKSENTGYTDKEYEQMAKEISIQRQTCLNILNDFFARVTNKAENISDPSDLIIIQDICY